MRDTRLYIEQNYFAIKYKRPPERLKKREREKSAGEFYENKSSNSCSACDFSG